MLPSMQRQLLLNGRGRRGSRARALHGRRGALGEIRDADGVDGRGDAEDDPFGRKRRGEQAAHGEQRRYANECCSAKKPSMPEHSLPPLVERFNAVEKLLYSGANASEWQAGDIQMR